MELKAPKSGSYSPSRKLFSNSIYYEQEQKNSIFIDLSVTTLASVWSSCKQHLAARLSSYQSIRHLLFRRSRMAGWSYCHEH
jgi:hypothetical protein